MARLPRHATDVLLVLLGVLLAAAVTVDLVRSTELAPRMRRDSLALRASLHPRWHAASARHAPRSGAGATTGSNAKAAPSWNAYKTPRGQVPLLP